MQSLTRRELEVLRLICDGYATGAIAAQDIVKLGGWL